MDSSHSSSFFNMLANTSVSEDENKNRSNITINSDKTLNKTISPFNQNSNDAIKYFKKLKRKIPFHNTEPQLKNVATSPYLISSLNTKHDLPESKNNSNTKKNKQPFNFVSIDLNKEFENSFKSSLDHDDPGLKYLKFVTKNEDVCISPEGKIPRPKYESYSSLTNKSTSTVNSSVKNNKCNEQSSMSSNSNDSYQINGKIAFLKQITEQKTDSRVNLNELFGDRGLSDVLIACKDSDESRSLSPSITDRTHSSYPFVNIESPLSQIEFTPKQPHSQFNVSLESSDNPIPQVKSNAISISDLIEDNSSDQQKQIVGEQSCMSNHKHSEVNNFNICSEDISSNIPSARLKLSVCTSIDSVNFEPHYSGRKRTSTRLQNNGTSSCHIISKKKNKNLRDKTYHSNSMISNSNESQCDADIDDNNMVELPNGAIVPSFLSTLKPKNTKKRCACGITMEKTPEYWSESFHNTLHQNIHKLCFVGKLPENDVVQLKHDNLSYKIFMLSVNYYNDKNIQKCILDVNDYVCLEYGISKLNINPLKNSIYLAVLPNLQVIGYLEVEPIHNAFILTHEEQFSDIVPAKYGIPKIWIFIKYKDKNVDINLLETFRKKEKLQKKDLAFTLGGCEGVQFIKKYIEKGNVLIYK